MEVRPTIKHQLEELREKYTDIGHADAEQIVILERGSRVIELKAPDHTESAFWTNPSAIAEGHWNVGGDRTWVSPELDYFVDGSGEYGIPNQLDPGTYSLTADPLSHSASTEQTFIAINSRARKDIALNLRKQYSPIPNPLSTNLSPEHADLLGISYAGYECQTRLGVLSEQPARTVDAQGSDAKSWCNIWSITQVPMGGTVLIPTIGSAEPLVMFKQGDSIAMEVHPHYLKVAYDGSHRFKLSLDALQSTGRFGYWRQINEEESSLLVRQFHVRPAGHYPDYPGSQPNYTGSCMQFFFDGNQMGGFGELEYHVPAIQGANSVSTDVSQLYYFVGKTAEIRKICERMLGIKL